MPSPAKRSPKGLSRTIGLRGPWYEENAILFLDELDGAMQNRSGATAGWEVRQVNAKRLKRDRIGMSYVNEGKAILSEEFGKDYATTRQPY